MFTKRRDFYIRNDKVISFVKLLGEYGLKFKVGRMTTEHNLKYRRIVVYGGPWKMAKLFNAVHICMLANRNFYE